MIQLDTLAEGTETDYSFTTELDGIPCVFRLVYSTRGERWTVSIALEDGTPLVTGRPLALDVDLLYRCDTPGRPPGRVFAMSIFADAESPKLTEIGVEAKTGLFYAVV